MAEISNTTLALLVFATLIAVVTTTVVLVNKETAYGTGGLTGFAPVDTGVVNLTIEASLHIQVDPGNDTIDFGACTPRTGGYWCASNDTLACDGVAGDNCTGDTATPQFIQVENIGNVNASVNVSTADGCAAAGLIGGTGPLFQYITTNCQGTNVTTWTSLVEEGTGSTAACDLLEISQSFRMYANITIPQDAAQTCPSGTATITFSAIQAP